MIYIFLFTDDPKFGKRKKDCGKLMSSIKFNHSIINESNTNISWVSLEHIWQTLINLVEDL